MAGNQTLIKTAAGLYSQHNPVNAAPEGALLQAENCSIDREGILSSRRGYEQYGSDLPGVADDVMEYKGRLLVRIDGEVYADSDGSGSSWNVWTDPDSNTNIFNPSSGWKSSFVESNGNFFVTTSNGVWKNDAITNNPTISGMPKGLLNKISLRDSGAAANNWLPNNEQVAYKIAWYREDENGNLVRGAPSQRYQILNDSGSDKSIRIVIDIPTEILAGDVYEVYRTFKVSGSSTIDERYYRIAAQTVTTAVLAIRDSPSVFNYDDIYPESDYLGDSDAIALYTNDNMEGSGQKNDRPPHSKLMIEYEGHIFYANTRREHQVSFRLLNTENLTDDVSAILITTGGETLKFYFSTADDHANLKFTRSSGGTFSQDIRDTMQSFCLAVNSYASGNTLVWADYISGVNDNPGKVLIRRRDFTNEPIYMTADSDTTGEEFEPNLPDYGYTVISDNDTNQNSISISKYQQPEAVPWLNTLELGSRDKPILAMKALKDALIVEKEDGLYIISGKTDGASGATFKAEILDPTVRIKARNSAAVLDNSLWSYTNLGIIKAVAGGSLVVSRPIEPDLTKIAEFSNFDSLSFGIAYESDKKYLLATQEYSSDAYATIIWVFNYFTKAWTLWRKSVSCGIVLQSDDRLYFGDATSARILRERKTYSSDYDDDQDETDSATVTATGTTTDNNGATVTTVTVTYTGSETLAAGFGIEQGSLYSRVTAVTDNGGNSYTLALDEYKGFITGACTLYKSIHMKVIYAPLDGGNVSALKQFASAQFYMEKNSAFNHTLGFHADTQPEEELVSDIRFPREATEVTYFGWGQFEWGNEPWSEEHTNPFTYDTVSTPIRTIIPRGHQKCRALKVIYRHNTAKEKVNILQLGVDVRIMGSRTTRRME